MNDNLITLCMIVKNEEETLERCLHSVYQYLDEIIIVDTGSTDRTIEIAKRYTDHLYHFDWINDFSAARNESLKYATGKWILYLDADDYMDQKDIASLRQLLYDMQPKPDLVYQIPYTSLLGHDERGSTNMSYAIRVFPNHMGLRFHRPIHEQLESTRGAKLTASKINIPIYHTGYTKAAMASKKKHERNLSIFNEMKQHTPYNSYDYFTLGNQYLVMGNYEEALSAYQSSWDTSTKNNKTNVWIPPLLLSTLETLMRMNRLFQAWAFVEEKMPSCYEYSDVRCYMGIILHNLGFWEKSKQEFLNAIQLSEERIVQNLDPYILSPENSMLVPLRHLAQIYERENNFPQAIQYLTKILIANPKDVNAQSKIMELLSLNESSDSIIGFLEKLLQVGSDPLKITILCKLALSQGHKELATHYIEQCMPHGLLEPYELLRYYLLCNNKAGFEDVFLKNCQAQFENSQFIKHLAIGAIVWRVLDWVDQMNINHDHEAFPYLEVSRKLINGQALPRDAASDNLIFDVLSDLYLLKQDQHYDQLIDQLATPELINRLASYFVLKHQNSIALQYQSYLIDHETLSAENSIHLAFMYLSLNNTEEALRFLEHALSLKPNSKDVYLLYCSISNNEQQKQLMKQRLLQIEPQYSSLSMFQSL